MLKTIKLNKEKFTKFLQLIALQGDIVNNEANLSLNNGTISALIGTSNKMVAFKGKMNTGSNNSGSIGIDDISQLIKFLNIFSSKIVNLQLQENKIVLTSKEDKIRVSTVLRNPKYILNTLEEDKFKTLLTKAKGNEFTLKNDVVKSITKYVDTMGVKNLVLVGENKKIVLELETNQNEMVADFEVKKQFKPFKVKFSQIFVSLLGVIDSDITLSIQNDMPVYLKTGDKDYQFEYVVSPVIDK